MIYILIPSFGQLDKLTKCVKSLEERTYRDDVRLLISYENWNLGKPRGFPATVNDLIKLAFTDKNCSEIVLLNNDIEIITDRWLDKIHDSVKNREDIGIVGALELISSPEGDYCQLPFSGEKVLPGPGVPMDVVYVGFGFAWMKREVIEKVGMLDVGFSPGYYEDCDYGIRTWIAGYRIVALPDVLFYHYRGATFRELAAKGFFTSTDPQCSLLHEKWKGLFKSGEDAKTVLERLRHYVKPG